MEKITIYTANTCGYCKTIKEEFEKSNIKFENRLTNEWKDEWNKVVQIFWHANYAKLYTTKIIFYTSKRFWQWFTTVNKYT